MDIGIVSIAERGSGKERGIMGVILLQEVFLCF